MCEENEENIKKLFMFRWISSYKRSDAKGLSDKAGKPGGVFNK